MDKFIIEKRNFLPEDLCERIIERFEKSNKSENGSYLCYSLNKIVSKNKYNEELNMQEHGDWEDLIKEITPYIDKAWEMYDFHLFKTFNYPNQEYHPMDRLLKRKCYNFGYLIHKIKKGDRYEFHLDSEPIFPEYIQMIIYLNTVNKGGRTFLISEEDCAIKPETGKILIFPCSWTFPHSGEKIGDNPKYILTVSLAVHPR